MAQPLCVVLDRECRIIIFVGRNCGRKTSQVDFFEERRRAAEARFAFGEELQFKAYARADKELGLWASEKLKLSADMAQVYALDTVKADLEEPGPEDVLQKVISDLDGVVSEAEVRSKYTTLCEQQLAAVLNAK